MSNLPLSLTYLRTCAMMFSIYCVFYGVTQWLEDGRGLSPIAAGLVLLPMTGLATVVSVPVSRRNLVRGSLLAAAGATLVVGALLSLMNVHTAMVVLVVTTLIFGVAVGLASVSNQAALVAQVPSAQLGTASGLLRTFTYIGAILSSVLTGAAYSRGVTTSGLHTIAVALIVVAILVLALCAFDRRLPWRALRSETGLKQQHETGVPDDEGHQENLQEVPNVEEFNCSEQSGRSHHRGGRRDRARDRDRIG
jgi:MFS family permease